MTQRFFVIVHEIIDSKLDDRSNLVHLMETKMKQSQSEYFTFTQLIIAKLSRIEYPSHINTADNARQPTSLSEEAELADWSEMNVTNGRCTANI